MHRARWVMLVVFLVAGPCAAYRTQLATATRWRPSLGTVHKVTVWYESVERGKPLPAAKKIFNFSRSEPMRGLASFASSASRSALNTIIDADVREVSTWFSECITAFTEQKKPYIPPFMCIFRMNPAIKNTSVTMCLSLTKKQQLRGDITLRGYLKEPSSELVNLIMVSMIDDSFFTNHWRKGVLMVGALLAWCKRDNWRHGRELQVISTHDVAMQTDEEVFSKRHDTSHTSAFTEPVNKPLIDTEVQTQAVEMLDAAMQTDGVVDDGGRGTARVLPLRRHAVICGCDERDTMPEISVEAVYLAIYTPLVLSREYDLEKPRSYLFSWLERPSENRVAFQERACVLDDGSILFACNYGCARLIIHKGCQGVDIERLVRERESGQVRSDLVVIVHCVDSTAQKKADEESFLRDYCQSLASKYERFLGRLEGFDLVVIAKKHVSTSRHARRNGELEVNWVEFGLMELGGLGSLWGPKNPRRALRDFVASVRRGLARIAEWRRSEVRNAGKASE